MYQRPGASFRNNVMPVIPAPSTTQTQILPSVPPAIYKPAVFEFAPSVPGYRYGMGIFSSQNERSDGNIVWQVDNVGHPIMIFKVDKRILDIQTAMP